MQKLYNIIMYKAVLKVVLDGKNFLELILKRDQGFTQVLKRKLPPQPLI